MLGMGGVDWSLVEAVVACDGIQVMVGVSDQAKKENTRLLDKRDWRNKVRTIILPKEILLTSQNPIFWHISGVRGLAKRGNGYVTSTFTGVERHFQNLTEPNAFVHKSRGVIKIGLYSKIISCSALF